jgi:hypothetical protein
LQIAKSNPLLFGLNALGGGDHLVLGRHCHDGSHNARRTTLLGQAGYERAINLYLVKGEAP